MVRNILGEGERISVSGSNRVSCKTEQRCQRLLIDRLSLRNSTPGFASRKSARPSPAPE